MTDRTVEEETHVHGQLWDRLYDGYFSDKGMASGYVSGVMRVAQRERPSAIVDLGGGTGFILEQLVEAGIPEDIRLFDMDESERQLAVCRYPRIARAVGTFQTFCRGDFVGSTGSLMLICRSVLHYAGVLGQKPWLKHLRDQMKPGEWFVHQSGCTDDIEAELALDVFFEMAGVDKWVSQRDALIGLLEKEGFAVREDFPVPALRMPSETAAMRYRLAPERLAAIEADLRRACADRPDLFAVAPSGFVLNFPYRVFLCQAAQGTAG